MPLFRRHIVGDAVDQSSDYAAIGDARKAGSVTGDETEDLLELLKDVIVRPYILKLISYAYSDARQHIQMSRASQSARSYRTTSASA